MSQQNKELVQGVYDSFFKGDLEGVLSRLDDNIEWRTPGASDLPTAGVRRGRAQVRDFFQLLPTLFDFEDFKIETLVADGDRVVVLGSDTFIMKGTGTRLHEAWAHVYTIRNGKVVVFDEYLDTAAFAAEYRAAIARA